MCSTKVSFETISHLKHFFFGFDASNGKINFNNAQSTDESAVVTDGHHDSWSKAISMSNASSLSRIIIHPLLSGCYQSQLKIF